MSIADKLTTVAENVPKVYEAGKNAEYEAFWKTYTNNGNRTYWRYGFAEQGWKDEIFNPPEGLVKPTDARAMFQNSFVTKVTKKQVDFSIATTMRDVFNSSKLTECEISAVKCANLYTTFNACEVLETLSLDVSEITGYNNTFSECAALKNLTINGVIALNGFNVQWSVNLTHDSLMSIINALADKSADTSGTVWTVTLGETNIAKLTADEQNIAINKGWELG